MVSLIFCLGCRCLPFRCVLSMFYAWITVNLVFPVSKHLVSHRGDVGLGRMDSVCKGEWKGGKKILEPESFQSWFLIIFFLIAAETSQIKQFENIFMTTKALPFVLCFGDCHRLLFVSSLLRLFPTWFFSGLLSFLSICLDVYPSLI